MHLRSNALLVPILLIGLLSGGCLGPRKPSGLPVVSPAHARHDAAIYVLTDGVARPIDFLKSESKGLNHVTILGAVEHPGVYYFKGQTSLEAVISAASPIKRDSHCGSADLARVQILSSKRLPEEATFTVNYEKYLDRRIHNPGQAPWELKGGEVIHIAEWI